MATPPHADGPAEGPPKQKSPRLRVLVVDDDPDVAETLARAFRLAGHEVVVAYSGPAALVLAEVHDPHVVVSDIAMPVMSGYELAARIRERQKAGPLLIAFTGKGSEEDRARSRAAGFDHHFTKPADPGAIVDLAKEWAAGLSSPGAEPGLAPA